MTSERRQRGLDKMAQVYGWEVTDDGGRPDDFYGMTVEHLFAEVWTREGLSNRDRRLLLIGALVASGLDDVLEIQLPAALGNGELTPDDLREIVIFLAHYLGWPRAAKMNQRVETLIAAYEADGALP